MIFPYESLHRICRFHRHRNKSATNSRIPSEETRERVRYLLGMEKAGKITEEEEVELNEFEQFEHVMRMAKARASQDGARG